MIVLLPARNEIGNPPSPPFSKGGLGGFGNRFGYWNLRFIWDLDFGIWDLGQRSI